jgi:hypothetical protein
VARLSTGPPPSTINAPRTETRGALVCAHNQVNAPTGGAGALLAVGLWVLGAGDQKGRGVESRPRPTPQPTELLGADVDRTCR